MPLDAVARLEELEPLLLALPGEPMLGSTLDGFVAGILVCPTPIAPAEWLPEIWGEDAGQDGAPVSETGQAAHVTRLIMAHYHAVARALSAGRGRYEVVYDVDTRQDDTVWEVWIEGFARAMALRPSSWDSAANAGLDTRLALAGLLALIEIAERGAARVDPEIERLIAMAPDLIPGWVEDLYAWRMARLCGTAARPVIAAGKVGRNEPCPCGSGRKSKKCCGAH